MSISRYKHIITNINNIWKMLNKYYNLIDVSSVYITIVMLNL